MSEEELKVTKEHVRTAARTCTDAANVLKVLFPEAWDDEPQLKPGDVIEWVGRESTGLLVVADESLTGLLDARYGGKVAPYGVRAISLQNGASYVLPRKDAKLAPKEVQDVLHRG